MRMFMLHYILSSFCSGIGKGYFINLDTLTVWLEGNSKQKEGMKKEKTCNLGLYLHKIILNF